MSFVISIELKNRISEYRKFVASKKKLIYKKTLIKWIKINRNKFVDQQTQKFAASNDSNRIHSLNHVLRILTNFLYLINYVYTENDDEIENCFTTKNVKNRKNVFVENLRNIFDFSSKYNHLLRIIHDDVERNYQFADKLVIDNAHSISIFLIQKISSSFLVNKNVSLNSCSLFCQFDLFIFDVLIKSIHLM